MPNDQSITRRLQAIGSRNGGGLLIQIVIWSNLHGDMQQFIYERNVYSEYI